MSLEIGLRLKEARESLGLTIQDIRDQTRIESGYLIALENGDFDKLPSPYFVRTCIRAYAKCVGIEPHHLLKKYHPSPGDSGASNSSKKRNTGRQQAVQDRSRFTSTYPRIDESANAPDGEGGRLERTTRMDALSRTNPGLGSKLPSNENAPYERSSRRENYHTDPGRTDDSGAAPIKRNTGRQQAVPDRTRFTSRFSRLSSRGESDRAGEEWGKEGAPVPSEHTTHMDSLSKRSNLSRGTDPAEEPTSRYPIPKDFSSRSRRSERAQESSSSRKIRRVVMIAGVALVIPIAAWGAFTLLKDDSSGEASPPTAEQQSEPEGVNAEPLSEPEEDASASGEGEAEVTLVENSGGVAHYQTAAGEMMIEIGPVTDVCWVQVREKREGGNYLKDVTLRNNESFKYEHPAEGSSELYIELGAPHAVQQIKVNGQSIDSSKIIHIERTE